MKTICATKKLSPKGRAFLKSKGVHVTDYNAIDIQFLEFEIPDGYEYLIFTSQNAVKSYLRHVLKATSPVYGGSKCFCVGSKTGALLEKYGYKVLKKAKDAEALGNYLVANQREARFLFLCGNRRRAALPAILNENGVALKEVVVYKNKAVLKQMPGVFDGVLFFSPSGVESFFSVNSTDGIAFCIGETTALAAKRFTDNVAVSEAATTGKLLELAVSRLVKTRVK